MLNADIADIVNYLKDKGLEYTWRGAIIGGDIDRINDFLQNGQDIEERTGYFCEGGYQLTGVQMATKFGRYSIARYLMVLGAVVPRDVCQMQLPYEHDVTACPSGLLLVSRPICMIALARGCSRVPSLP